MTTTEYLQDGDKTKVCKYTICHKAEKMGKDDICVGGKYRCMESFLGHCKISFHLFE